MRQMALEDIGGHILLDSRGHPRLRARSDTRRVTDHARNLVGINFKFRTDPITAARFEKSTGRPPVDDDLERCNCAKPGYGWDPLQNRPKFTIGGRG